MASEESFVVLVHYRGSIKRKTRSGVKFTDKNSLMLRDDVKYDSFVIGSDEDLAPELLAKLVDVVSSLGGSNRNIQTLGTVAGSSSRPVGACSSVPCGTLAEIDDALLDDDVELDLIADDSGDDIVASNLAGASGGSNSGTQQYPPHFSSLDLDAMRQEGVPAEPTEFGARDTQGTGGLTKFQVGQQFQDKEEDVLSVKTYSIRSQAKSPTAQRYLGGKTVQRTSYLSRNVDLDHRNLDYQVISAFIMPMVRADASVCIKILLNATEAHFEFMPTYRRVWLAKQKATAHILQIIDLILVLLPCKTYR
ncbi:uncharacterized protein LOC130946020 [Arachis stenosperma]|uniref:uncharacterized protein LOC130946020 n=1 Tax=Arachis stenosperma TaxID=217475 RepID=UPI0025ACD50F|nr:uncharacterized protein LOC130946020 [Arachis stenosperma]